MQATWPKRWPRRGRGRLACLPALLPAFKCNSKVNEATQASFHCAANLIGFNSTAAPAAPKKKKEYHMASSCKTGSCSQPSSSSSSGLAAAVAGCGPTWCIRNTSCCVRILVCRLLAREKSGLEEFSYWQGSPANPARVQSMLWQLEALQVDKPLWDYVWLLSMH